MQLSHAELEPNWEYVQQMVELQGEKVENFTWQRTLEEVGTFCVQGFLDIDKKLGQVISRN